MGRHDVERKCLKCSEGCRSDVGEDDDNRIQLPNIDDALDLKTFNMLPHKWIKPLNLYICN
jgi:hypothetical protein